MLFYSKKVFLKKIVHGEVWHRILFFADNLVCFINCVTIINLVRYTH